MKRFKFRIRTQFSFTVNDRTLSCILKGIADQKVNIDGYFQTKIRKKTNCNVVRLVVGPVEFETQKDLRVVRRVLRTLGVKFQEKKIIQVFGFPAEVPGIINNLFGALWCKLKVKAIYLGEKSKIYLDVSDIPKTIQILSEGKITQCPKRCRPSTGINCKIS